MKPVVIAGILAVFVVLVASPVIAQEEITESLQSILDGLQAEITTLVQAAEQRDQQLKNMTDNIETMTNALEGLDARLSSLEITCSEGQTVVNGVCQNIVCPTGYSLSGSECVEDVESITNPEPLADYFTYHPDGSVKHHSTYYDNGSIKSETDYLPDGFMTRQMICNEYDCITTYYNSDGTSKSVLSDENARVEIKYDVDGTKISQYTYDVNGFKESYIMYYDGWSKVISYLPNGNTKSEIWYDSDGLIFHQELYEYQSNGTIISFTYYDSDGVMASQDLYDNNGKIKSHTEYRSDGSVKEQGLYDVYPASYTKYRSDGSMIEQRLFNSSWDTVTYYSPDGSIERQFLYNGPEVVCEIHYDSDGVEVDKVLKNGYTEC